VSQPLERLENARIEAALRPAPGAAAQGDGLVEAAFDDDRSAVAEPGVQPGDRAVSPVAGQRLVDRTELGDDRRPDGVRGGLIDIGEGQPERRTEDSGGKRPQGAPDAPVDPLVGGGGLGGRTADGGLFVPPPRALPPLPEPWPRWTGIAGRDSVSDIELPSFSTAATDRSSDARRAWSVVNRSVTSV
jgi:hypothetical protein